MKYLRIAPALLVVVAIGLASWLGPIWWMQRQWFALQREQMSTIMRLGELPPTGWSRDGWRNAVVTLHNVWGNVTYHPTYSGIDVPQMRSLQSDLDRILGETTAENCLESVDRVFELLLPYGKDPRFITGYRDEFRRYREAGPGSEVGEQVDVLPRGVGPAPDVESLPREP